MQPWRKSAQNTAPSASPPTAAACRLPPPATDRARDLLTANNSAVGQAIGAGKMVVGGAEVLGGVAGAAAGAPTVVGAVPLALAGAVVGSLVVYDGVDTTWNGFQETRADHPAPLGQGVLQSLNPDNPVSVQDQVLQQRLEQAGLTSENMIAAGAVAMGGAAVRGAQKAFAPVTRAIGRTADDILASAPVQAMGNSARKLAGDIGEKAGHALDRVAEKVGLGGLKPATGRRRQSQHLDPHHTGHLGCKNRPGAWQEVWTSRDRAIGKSE